MQAQAADRRRQAPSVLDKPMTKGRQEVSLSAYAFLFSEIVQYSQKRVSGIQDLEDRCAQ